MTRNALEFIDTRNVFWRQLAPSHVTKASKQVLKQVPVGGNPRRVQAQIDRTLNEMKRLYMSTYLDQYEYVVFVIVALVFIAHLLTSLRALLTVMKHKHYNRVIKAAKQLTDELNKLAKPLPGQEQVLANCACLLGDAYLEKRDDKRALAYHMQDYNIGTEW